MRTDSVLTGAEMSTLRDEALWQVAERTTLFAEVDNVYNRDNVYIYEWSRALRQTQPILQWGLTPIGGVRIDF